LRSHEKNDDRNRSLNGYKDIVIRLDGENLEILLESSKKLGLNFVKHYNTNEVSQN